MDRKGSCRAPALDRNRKKDPMRTCHAGPAPRTQAAVVLSPAAHRILLGTQALIHASNMNINFVLR